MVKRYGDEARAHGDTLAEELAATGDHAAAGLALTCIKGNVLGCL
jgi:hypothetical protein